MAIANREEPIVGDATEEELAAGLELIEWMESGVTNAEADDWMPVDMLAVMQSTTAKLRAAHGNGKASPVFEQQELNCLEGALAAYKYDIIINGVPEGK